MTRPIRMILLSVTALILVVHVKTLAAAQSATNSSRAAGRLYVVSHIDVTPMFAAATAKALEEFAAASRKDAGIVRIDILREAGRPNHFTMMEVWEARSAFDTHVSHDHTKSFRDTLQPMLGSPYDERLHESLE